MFAKQQVHLCSSSASQPPTYMISNHGAKWPGLQVEGLEYCSKGRAALGSHVICPKGDRP